ncbi:MAG: type II secretion system F family protein, partial [Candidatus Nanopelagicales bacterium]
MSQFVALCLTAGVTTAEALGLAADEVGTPLGPHLQHVATQVRAGRPLAQALSGVSRQLEVAEL